MRLERLHLRRLPGIDPPFAVEDFSPGVNLIVGPNGSGKSSLCRAVRALLWPTSEPGATLWVESSWSVGTRRLRAEREDDRTSWEVAGVPGDAPPLPDRHLASCFTLSIADLLQADAAADKDIARRVRLEMFGRYDLDAVGEALFALRPMHGVHESRELARVEGTRAQIEREFRELAADEVGLQRLASELGAAHEARDTLPAMREALELAERRAELEAVREALRAFPAGVSRLRGDEAERVEELEADLARAREEHETAARRVAEARRRREANAAPGEQVEPAELAGFVERVRDLLASEQDRDRLTEHYAAREGDVDAARAELGGLDEADAVRLDLEALDDVDRHLRRAATVREERAALEAELALLEDGEASDPETLTEATSALRAWLATPLAAEMPAPAALIGIAAAALALAVGLGLLVHPGWLGLAGVGLGSLGVLVVARRARALAAARLAEIEERFEAGPIAPPAEWTRAAVERRLREVEIESARTRVAQRQGERRSELLRKLERVTERERRVAAGRQRLRASLGLDPEASDLALVELARRVADFRTALRRRSEVGAELSARRAAHDATLAEVSSFLTAHGRPARPSARAAEAELAELGRRDREHAEALREERRADEERERIAAVGTARERQLAELYGELDLEANDRAGLARLLELFQEYRERRVREQTGAARVAELAHRLEDRPELSGVEPQVLREWLEQAERTAARADEIARTVGGIEERIKSAGLGGRLEATLAEAQAARETLSEKREEALLRMAGSCLLDDVLGAYERERRPVVVQRAIELFARFTHYRYELALDLERQEFRAFDTQEARGKALEELSDGTRIQLLLAARLAFAASAEVGTPLPVFLDEVLGTADPDRFEAVAESLIALAAEGRQIFYLTAVTDDVVRWRRVAREQGAPQPRVVDLALVRWNQSSVTRPEQLELIPRPQVPSPRGRSPEEYGAVLGVPLPDPARPAESLHLYHLLRDDLELLSTLLAMKISTAGQWRALSGKPAAAHYVSTREQRAKLDARVDVARAVWSAWRVGRGLPVDREVLEASGAVSANFLEGLSAICAETGGDAERLLAVLEARDDERVKGFLRKKQETLAAHLETGGYLDPRAILEAAAATPRVLEAVGGHLVRGAIANTEVSALVEALWEGLARSAEEAAAGAAEASGAERTEA